MGEVEEDFDDDDENDLDFNNIIKEYNRTVVNTLTTQECCKTQLTIEN